MSDPAITDENLEIAANDADRKYQDYLDEKASDLMGDNRVYFGNIQQYMDFFDVMREVDVESLKLAIFKVLLATDYESSVEARFELSDVLYGAADRVIDRIKDELI